MIRSWASCLIGALMALTFMTTTGDVEAVPLGQASPSSVVRECGHMPNHFAFNIKTRNVFCGKARRVVRRWGQTAARKRGGDGWVFGLYCNYRSTGYEAGKIRCARRERVVRWQTAS
jgi:hypothetical protein